jgi:putative ABC transport system substrate-binding protein
MWIQQLTLLAARHALPTSFSSNEYVTAGGLMSYGPDQMESYREAGAYAGRVLKGEKPADLPVLVATKYDFMINLKTAKVLDIAIPPSMLAIATSVLE